MVGRVLTETMPGGSIPEYSKKVLRSDPDADGHVTQLNYQVLGDVSYFDAAGYPDRTLGLE